MEQQRLTTSITIMVVLMVAASLFAGATDQSSSSCTNVLISSSPCLSYITVLISIGSSSACNVKTPSISQCTTAASPTGSTISPSAVPSGSSGNSVPTTSGGSSDGGAMKTSLPVLLSLLFISL